jgi:hypothetical protein
MTEPRSRRRGLILAVGLTLAVALLGPAAADAGERFYAIVFGAEQRPNRPAYTHSWATVVRVTDCGELEVHTISWLACRGVVEVRARSPEPGRNYSLEETIAWALANRMEIAAWGPFEVEPELFRRVLWQEERLLHKRYKANDIGYPAAEVSNCIHSVAELSPTAARLWLFEPGWGVPASRILTLRLSRYFIHPERCHAWVAERIGLCQYPIHFVEVGLLPRCLPLLRSLLR